MKRGKMEECKNKGRKNKLQKEEHNDRVNKGNIIKTEKKQKKKQKEDEKKSVDIERYKNEKGKHKRE
jgi:hypothetical protein